MLNATDVLMINCLGSYFYSIIQYVNESSSKRTLLYYLATGSLNYQPLSLQSVQEKYGTNPWGYQPIILSDIQGWPLSINDRFFEYLLNTHRVIVKTFDMNQCYITLEKLLIRCKNDRQFLVVSVDEYYLCSSVRFYRKQHNKHFLLIREIDFLLKKVKIIDSEKNEAYLLTFHELAEAVYCSTYTRKIVYHIDCGCYVDAIIKENALESVIMYEQNKCISKVLVQLEEDIVDKLTVNHKHEKYFFKGYYYTILSKLYPYSLMIHQVMVDNKSASSDTAKELCNEWRSLCNFMRYKMEKGAVASQSLVKRMDRIIEKQNMLDTQLCMTDIQRY